MQNSDLPLPRWTGLAPYLAAELDALRAVAEAARRLPKGEWDSLAGGVYSTLVTPEDLDAVHDALAALDKVREAGGGV